MSAGKGGEIRREGEKKGERIPERQIGVICDVCGSFPLKTSGFPPSYDAYFRIDVDGAEHG